MLSEQLAHALEKYLNAPTLREARRVLEASPELVGPEAPGLAVDAFLLEMVKRCGVRSEVADHIRARASLLVRARHLGIEEAFEDASQAGDQEPGEWSQEGEAERLTGTHPDSLEGLARLVDPGTWASMQADAGNRLLTSTSGDKAMNVEAAIRHYRAALQVRTPDGTSREWASTMHNLGRAFSRRVYGNPKENVAAAIRSYEAALTIAPPQQAPAEWAETACWLAAAYVAQRSEDRASNLTRASMLLGRVLELGLAEAVSRDWAMAMFHLVEACHATMRAGPPDDAGKVVPIYWAALELEERRLRAGNADAAGAAARDSALSYIGQLKRDVTRRPEDAVLVYGKGAEVISPKQAPVAWAIVMNHLGIAHDRSPSGSRAENLDHAIGTYRKALDALDAEDQPITWAELQFNLGKAWFERIRGDRAENLECCIDALKKAAQLNLQNRRPDHWADTMSQLGLAYFERVQGVRPSNLETAIEYCRKALEVRTREKEPVKWGIVMHNLCTIYRTRVLGDPAENAKLAIECGEAALSVTSRKQMPVDWAATKSNLGLAYAMAAPQDPASQPDIEAFREALEVFDADSHPRQWAQITYHLAVAHARRAAKGQRGQFGKAVQHYRQSIDVLSRRGFPAQLLQAQHGLAGFLFGKRRWREAEAAYAAALDTARTLLGETYTDDGRMAQLDTTSRVVPRHAYCLLRLGKPGEALMRLEQGKGRLLAEALALSDVQLAHMPEAQRDAVRSARQAVKELEAEMRVPPGTGARRSDRDLAEALHQTRFHLHALIREGHGDRQDALPSGLDLRTLLGLIPEGGALVAPVLTPDGSAAIVLPHLTQEVGMEHVLWLPGLTTAKLEELLRGQPDALRGWFGAYLDARAPERGAEARSRWLDTVEDGLDRLWRMLMGPVHARLRRLRLGKHAPVLLMPQGGLGLLPLHAAYRETPTGRRRCFLDDWTVSYAPSGYALSVGKQRLTHAKRRERTLLAVIDPTGDLPFTPLEGDAVAALFDSSARKILPGEKATKDTVAQTIGRHSYLHFSCHGSWEWMQPMQSALLLAGGQRLTLADVMGPKFDLDAARLVVLSACETGLTDVRHTPDEFIGLPAGFLQAGAPTVVATLWPVDDISTSLLMEEFYRRHLGDGLPPAAALRAAQLWLRDSSARQLNLAERWKQVQRRATNMNLIAEASHQSAHYEEHPEERPFAHPHHWAAFSVVGA